MTKKDKKPQVDFHGITLTVTETTDIELKNPDIVKELLRYSGCKLKEDSEGKPIIVAGTYCHDLVPSVEAVESAQKEIKEFEDSLKETDAEVERIKFIVERLLEKKA